jgi:hypothetical protein
MRSAIAFYLAAIMHSVHALPVVRRSLGHTVQTVAQAAANEGLAIQVSDMPVADAQEANPSLHKRADDASIASDVLEAKFDKGRGASLYYLALKGKENVVDFHDAGRLIQQSYYGAADGTVWKRVRFCNLNHSNRYSLETIRRMLGRSTPFKVEVTKITCRRL